MRIVFAGTPDIAARILEALLTTEHEIVAVYTQPDRPAGRGQKLAMSAVKKLALEHAIPVEQPKSLKSDQAQQTLKNYNADLMVVSAYGLLLPKAVLDMPKHGCWNVHYSLLPRWRGATPVNRPIEMGDHNTGVTVMQMDVGLDTGDILHVLKTQIGARETAGELYERLAQLGQQALLETLQQLEANQLSATPQNENNATYAPKFTKEESDIDWSQPADVLERKIRAFNPWPVMHSALQGERVRIWMASAFDEASNKTPGTVVGNDDTGLSVATGNGILKIVTLQLPGKKALPFSQLRHGHTTLFAIGNRFQ